MTRLRDRSTGDILVLLVGGTICVSVLIGAVGLIWAGVTGDAENPGAITLVSDTLVALTSLLAGFIAGRSAGNTSNGHKDTPESGSGDDAPAP